MDLNQRFIEVASIFGSRLLEVRKSLTLSQKQLGEVCYVNEKQIRNIEHGISNFEFKTIFRIARGLSLPMAFFFDFSNVNLPKHVKYGKLLKEDLKQEQIKFGSRLSKLADHRGLTQEDLAVLSKCTNSEISHFINGSGNLVLMTLLKLAIALEVEVSDLFDYQGPLPSNKTFKGKIQI